MRWHRLRVAFKAWRGDRTVQEIAARHEVHPNQVSPWQRQAIDALDEIVGGGRTSRQSEHEATVRNLHAKIGELTVVALRSRAPTARRLSKGVGASSLARVATDLASHATPHDRDASAPVRSRYHRHCSLAWP